VMTYSLHKQSILCFFLHQVEYSYPPLIPGRPVHCSECPEQWKQLPSLALPDGAHNYTEGTVM